MGKDGPRAGHHVVEIGGQQQPIKDVFVVGLNIEAGKAVNQGNELENAKDNRQHADQHYQGIAILSQSHFFPVAVFLQHGANFL